MWLSLLFVVFSATLVWPQEETCAPYTPSDYVTNSSVPTHCNTEVLNCTRSWKSGIPLGSSTDLPLIDSNFILCHEGFHTCAYVPIDPDTGEVLANSGVHIGGGVDLGARDRAGLAGIGVPSEIIDILETYLQVKSDDAACAVIDRSLSLTNDQALNLTNAVIDSIVSSAQTRYNAERSVSAMEFTSLSKAMRTAIVDLWYHLGPPDNYGDVWCRITRNDWDGLVVSLREFYSSPIQELIIDLRRRHNEADIINAALEKCTRSADIVFLQDESGSIGASDFTLSLDFINQIISAFPDENLNDAKGTRFGLSLFSTFYRKKFNLSTHMSRTAYTDAVTSVSQRSKTTLLGAALNQIVDDQFTELYGLRPESLGFPKVLVVLTDGMSQDAVEVPSQNVRDRNIVIYAIGIGGYDLAQLNSIASSLTRHVFILNQFSDLSKFAATLTASTCYEPQPIPFQLRISGELLVNEFQYFQFEVSIGDYLQVVVTDFSGETLVFASRETPHPYEYDNNFGVLSSSISFKEIVISPVASSARLRRSSHVNATFPVYVSVKGVSSNNTFVLVGGPCDPAVCTQGASAASVLQVSLPLLALMCAFLLRF